MMVMIVLRRRRMVIMMVMTVMTVMIKEKRRTIMAQLYANPMKTIPRPTQILTQTVTQTWQPPSMHIYTMSNINDFNWH